MLCCSAERLPRETRPPPLDPPAPPPLMAGPPGIPAIWLLGMDRYLPTVFALTISSGVDVMERARESAALPASCPRSAAAPVTHRRSLGTCGRRVP
jgi:hypothetical protein